MPIPELKLIEQDKLHHTIAKYIKDNEIIIGNYEDMIELILSMVRVGYCFNIDRERLRDCMEDVTYMCCPEDDANKDRVVQGLEYDDGEEEEDDEEEGDDDSIEDIIRNDLM